MKILIVSSYLPHPLTNGGNIRLFNLIKRLSPKHQITLVCEKRDYQTKQDVSVVENLVDRLFYFPRGRQWSFSNILKASVSSYPFLMVGHTHKKMALKLDELVKRENFDLVHAETFYVAQNLPIELIKARKIPFVLAEHNIEYMVYERYAKSLPLPLRSVLQLDIAKIKKWERFFWEKADAVIAVSEVEKKIIGRKNVFVVPNGVDTQMYKPRDPKSKITEEEKRILFIGDFKWIQNRDSLEWILKEIWPKISQISNVKSQKSVGLWVVGKNVPENLKNLGDKSVIFDENCTLETAEIYRKAYMLLAPIRVGAGTSYKIIEAMASGIPVVTTPLGNEGISALPNEQILISENAEELYIMVLQLLNDQDLYSKISKNAGKYAAEKFNWDLIVNKLEEVYKSKADK